MKKVFVIAAVLICAIGSTAFSADKFFNLTGYAPGQDTPNTWINSNRPMVGAKVIKYNDPDIMALCSASPSVNKAIVASCDTDPVGEETFYKTQFKNHTGFTPFVTSKGVPVWWKEMCSDNPDENMTKHEGYVAGSTTEIKRKGIYRTCVVEVKYWDAGWKDNKYQPPAILPPVEINEEWTIFGAGK